VREQTDIPSIPIQRNGDRLIVSIQIDLDDAILAQLRDDLLEAVRAQTAKAVILDLTGVAVLDAHEFESLRQLLEMCAVMGARPLLCGLQAGVVSVLVDFGVDAGGIDTALDVESALALIETTEDTSDESPANEEVPADPTQGTEEDPVPDEVASA